MCRSDRSTVLFDATAPNAVVHAGAQGEGQTFILYRAFCADGLSQLDLADSGTGTADREEQIWVFMQAGSMISPITQDKHEHTPALA